VGPDSSYGRGLNRQGKKNLAGDKGFEDYVVGKVLL